MSAFSRASRLVDSGMGGKGGKPVSLLIPILPLAVVLVFPSVREFKAILVLVSLSLFLAAFVGWRAWRVSKAIALKSGRTYEKSVRHHLAAEYEETEDALLAKRRAKTNG